MTSAASIAAGLRLRPAGRLLADQGMLSRLLVAAPDSKAGQRRFIQPDTAAGAALVAYMEMIERLLDRPMPHKPGRPQELELPALGMSGEAAALWVAFHDDIEAQLARGGALVSIKALGNKLAEHAGRLAAVLTVIDNPEAPCICAPELRQAIALTRYYADEAKRLFDSSLTDHRLKDAQTLLLWLLDKWPHDVINIRDIYQRGPGSIRSKDRAAPLVAILEDHLWLIELPARDGNTRKWRINRAPLHPC